MVCCGHSRQPRDARASVPARKGVRMSLFEFVTVMISMILALSLGQLLTGVTFLIKTGRDIRWHAPHTLWLGFMGLTLVNHWWSLWDFNDIEWTYGAFMYVLIAPALVAFAVGLLAPDRSDTASNDLALQFARVRLPFAAVFCAYVLAMWFDGPLLAGQDPFGSVGLLHVPILAGGVLPLITDHRRANVLAPCIAATALATVMLIRFLR
jgi:hypothetical protein